MLRVIHYLWHFSFLKLVIFFWFKVWLPEKLPLLTIYLRLAFPMHRHSATDISNTKYNGLFYLHCHRYYQINNYVHEIHCLLVELQTALPKYFIINFQWRVDCWKFLNTRNTKYKVVIAYYYNYVYSHCTLYCKSHLHELICATWVLLLPGGHFYQKHKMACLCNHTNNSMLK